MSDDRDPSPKPPVVIPASVYDQLCAAFGSHFELDGPVEVEMAVRRWMAQPDDPLFADDRDGADDLRTLDTVEALTREITLRVVEELERTPRC